VDTLRNKRIPQTYIRLNRLDRTSYTPLRPNNKNIIAEIHLIVFSGMCLPITTPTIIPMASATTMPRVVPKSTKSIFGYLTARLIVASWVLSPISARKKAMPTVTIGPNLGSFFSSPSSLSPRIVHNPKIIKDNEAIKEMISIGELPHIKCYPRR
jgi:hypothetical protein